MTRLEHIWAKSPRPGETAGEQLTDHLLATLRAAVLVRDRVGEIAGMPRRFWAWVLLAALLHDAGKVADGFQAMVGNGLGPAQPWGQRHEVLSLGFAAGLLAGLPEDERTWVELGVVTHHRPLTATSGLGLFSRYNHADPAGFAAVFGLVDPQAASELMRWLAATAASQGLLAAAPGGLPAAGPAEAAHAALAGLRATWRYPVGTEQGRTGVMLQGAVTLADHLSSAGAGAGMHTAQPLDAAYVGALATRFDLRDHQRRAAEVDGHLLLRAPTGAGKTEAAQLWAARQAQSLRASSGGQPRVFYTLPYLASINAMADRLGDSLGDRDLIGVAHSRAGLYHLNRSLCDDTLSSAAPAGPAGITVATAAAKAASRAAATRLFRELVRVGTPYQLLRGALAGPGCSGILIDSANSVFILDELHAYDPRRLGFILAITGFWERLGGRIAVISATLPGALAAMLGGTLDAPLTLIEATDGIWPVRHRLTVRPDHLTAESSMREIEARLHTDQAVLVTANNIADARALFERLAPAAIGLHGDGAAELLHSRFRAMDRAKIETRIRGRYRTRAGHQPPPGLVVATQVVEVSLDVDFDALHTSGAPLEALIQRSGRVNRLGERPPADVVVHSPEYRARRGGGAQLFADGVYEAEPAKLAMTILARHDGATLSERDLAAWLDDVYAGEWGQQWAASVTHHRGVFEEAFLGFAMPFDDREALAERFDQLFDGTEAILTGDVTAYREALNSTRPRAGRLLGAQYLIPLPHYARPLGRYKPDLKVTVIDADYDPRSGLGQIHDPGGPQYQPGEVL